MLSTMNILYCLVLSLALITASYLAGVLLDFAVSRFSGKKITNSVFWRTFGGLFFLVGMYAIFMTKGITILLPLPFLIPFLLRHTGAEQDKAYKGGNLIFYCLVCFICQFFMYVLFINYAGPGEIKFIVGDFNIYNRIAEGLNSTGIESNTFSLYPKLRGEISPYHYGDLWFYALAAKCCPINPSMVFLVSFTVLSFIFSVGLYQFVQQKFAGHSPAKARFLYFLILSGLFTGFGIFFPNFILKSAEPYVLAVFNWGKVLVLACSLIAIILSLKEKAIVLCLITVLSGLLYINAIPAIFSSVFLLLVARKIRRDISWKELIGSMALAFGLPLVFLLVLYKGVPVLFKLPSTHTDGMDFSYFLSGPYVKTAINIFIGGWFQLFTLTPYLLILLIGLFLNNRSIKHHFKAAVHSDLVLLLFFLFFSGLLSWAVLHPIAVDTVQFFHNILAPLYAITISVILMYLLFTVSNKIIKGSILLCVGASVCLCATSNIFYVGKMKKDEWVKMEAFFGNGQRDAHFVNIHPINYYSFWSSKNADMYIPLMQMSYFWRNYQNVALMTPFVQVDKSRLYYKEEKNVIENTFFSKYYRSKNLEGVSDGTTICKEFISEYKPTYLCIPYDTVCPDFLRPAITDSMQLNSTKMTVYKMKN